jgi:hypothetical protein
MTLVFTFLAGAAGAQMAQFFFDPTGNFLAEASQTAGPLQIIGQPQMQVVVPGDPASFSVLVADTSGVSYQWYFDTTPIPGATSDSLLIPNVNQANQGFYWVVVSNAFGTTASALANLYIDSRGCGMPDSWQLEYFGNLGQNSLSSLDGSGDSNLQDFLNGSNPTNAASARYRITLFNDGGTVVLSPNQSTYTNGQVVTLTAAGSSSAPFHAWTGDVVSRSGSIRVTMTKNLNLFAHFLPFTLVWTNTVSGDWNQAQNWMPNLAPSTNESVVIGDGAMVTENSNVDLMNFTLGTSAEGATLTGNGRITMAGIGTWNGGTMGGGGTLVVKPSAALTLLSSSGLTLDNWTLENAGAVAWVGGTLFLSGVITNDSGALFQFYGPSTLSYLSGAPRFDNAGSLVLASNAATYFEQIALNNYGSVNFQGGTLTLAGGGILGGPLYVPAGSSINLAFGTFSSTSNLMLSGAGTLAVNGGAGVLGGTINISGSNIFAGGSIDFTGDYICTNNTMLISGGSASFDGTGAIAPAFLTLNDLGNLGGAQTVTVGNVMNWTGGSMSGNGRTVIPPGVTLSAGNSSVISINSRTLDNAGTTVWNGTAVMNMSGGVITNEPGAMFQIQGPQSVGWGGGAPRIDNAGTLLISGGGTVAIGAALNNFNTVDISGAMLWLEGGGANYGSISVPAGTAINLDGSFTGTASSSITGAGQFVVSGGNSTLAGTVNVTGTNVFGPGGSVDFTGNYICTNTMQISGGSASFDGTGVVSPVFLTLNQNGNLGGAQTVGVGNAMNWFGGSMSGTGRTIIPLGATLTVDNASFVTINSRTLDNAGTVLWNGAGSVTTSGVITNRPGALFIVQNSVNWQVGGGSPRFDNAGTFRKSLSPGTMTFNSIPFSNYGTVDIQSGVLSENAGAYASSADAVLNCGIAGTQPGANYGQLHLSGAVTLNGTLSINFESSYLPATNASFTLVAAGSRSGTFSNFIYPSDQVSMLLSNTAVSVVAQVTGGVSAPPPPVFMPPVISASNILLTWSANSNFVYRLEYIPALPASDWNAVPGDVTTSSNTASKLDSLTPSNRFYRVQVLP